jgi:NAD(P)-dependent dehydrogenase (short-subunit alcohol dehydrogenase family)
MTRGGRQVGETGKTGRVALITGANKGIGFETARQLGKQGITVLVGSREKERGQKAVDTLRAEGIGARFIALDVSDQVTIDCAAAEVDRGFGRLDILVNNAGILLERIAPSECQVENLRKTFDTNVFGLFAVTKAFLPLLRKSAAGRIVNVTSALGSLAVMSDPQRLENKFLAYSASKAAVNMMTVAFARELAGTKIKVNSAAPGYTATEMNNYSGTQTIAEGTVASVRLATLPDDGPTGGFLDAKGFVAW